MDNQQERSLLQKGWLAGIIDGEGCLQLARQQYKTTYHYRPQILIGNTNPVIVDGIIKGFRQLGIPFHVWYNEKPARRSKRPSWRITICGLRRCNKLLDVLGNHIMGKAEQVKIMRDFITYRFSIEKKHRTKMDDIYQERIKKANQRFKGEILNDYTLDGSEPKI